jgi:hypothetical protein
MRDGWLRDVEERDQLAHAHLACVLAQHVNELQPDRIAERLREPRDPDRLRALHIRVHHRLAAALALRALAPRRQL